jgi:hypothetical protein
MRWMVIYGHDVQGGALNLISTKLPRLRSHLENTLEGKIPIAKPGIEPGTS